MKRRRADLKLFGTARSRGARGEKGCLRLRPRRVGTLLPPPVGYEAMRGPVKARVDTRQAPAPVEGLGCRRDAPPLEQGDGILPQTRASGVR